MSTVVLTPEQQDKRKKNTDYFFTLVNQIFEDVLVPEVPGVKRKMPGNISNQIIEIGNFLSKMAKNIDKNLDLSQLHDFDKVAAKQNSMLLSILILASDVGKENNLQLLNIAKSLIDLDKDSIMIGLVNSVNDTPLIWACYHGEFNISLQLIRRGKDKCKPFVQEQENKFTALMHASKDGFAQIIAEILDMATSIDEIETFALVNNNGETALIKQCENLLIKEETYIILALIDKLKQLQQSLPPRSCNVHVQSKRNNESTALLAICREDYSDDIVLALIDLLTSETDPNKELNKASIGSQDKNGETALILLCKTSTLHEDERPCVEETTIIKLIETGHSNPGYFNQLDNSNSSQGVTALYIACYTLKLDVILKLLDLPDDGANVGQLIALNGYPENMLTTAFDYFLLAYIHHYTYDIPGQETQTRKARKIVAKCMYYFHNKKGEVPYLYKRYSRIICNDENLKQAIINEYGAPGQQAVDEICRDVIVATAPVSFQRELQAEYPTFILPVSVEAENANLRRRRMATSRSRSPVLDFPVASFRGPSTDPAGSVPIARPTAKAPDATIRDDLNYDLTGIPGYPTAGPMREPSPEALRRIDQGMYYEGANPMLYTSFDPNGPRPSYYQDFPRPPPSTGAPVEAQPLSRPPSPYSSSEDSDSDHDMGGGRKQKKHKKTRRKNKRTKSKRKTIKTLQKRTRRRKKRTTTIKRNFLTQM